MLKPHPAILRRLVEEYEEVMHRESREPVSRPGRRAQDLAYTLCVTMGTRDVRRAVAEARRQVAAGNEPMAGGAPVGA
ncbi:DUF5133 domain-containing protein [Streptomyces spongiae]|uniref:DUF5133 domain-containing protein n=1 Tax=Streptomyces spongiae TaxID=565072 RepID=A0A5N8XL56_9ACTN|nr:DUF5133 domain-containing protein [Streptomyces spongiae]MPY60201.1 DUF5133 domain-containing protein [Streptomyces spongiae]